jgi:twitching motility protein PilT
MAGLEPIDHRIRIVVKLLDSLLDAIVRLEGDALVMHVGEKPYVITTSAAMNAYRGPLAWGQVELSSRVLTFDAVSSMLAQILPVDQQRALDEMGAIEHEVLPPDGILDRFTVVAARGGEDVWVEVRRKPLPPAVADTPAPVEEVAAAPEVVPAAPAVDAVAPEPAAVQSAAVEPAIEEPAIEAPAAIEPTLAAAVAQPVEEPVAEIPPADESIVVALPGQDYEEVQLDQVSEDAIQIVDDEPQGVPTEAEVDAMLAATASALLSSGLSVDADTMLDDAARIDPAASIEFSASDETVLDLSFTQDAAPELAPRPEAAAEIELPHHAVPEFALSPPPAVVPEEAPTELVEAHVDTPQGAPLFSDEAVAAAAAVEPPVEIAPEPQLEIAPEPTHEIALEPAVAVVPEPEVVATPEPEPEIVAKSEPEIIAAPEPEPMALEPEPIALTPDVVQLAPDTVHEVQAAPAPVEEPVLAIEPPALPAYVEETPATPAAEDLSAHVAVWSRALTEWASEPAQAAMLAPEPIAPDSSNAVEPPPALEAMPSSSDLSAAQIPEMPMDATPEQRHEEPAAPHHHAAVASAESYDAPLAGRAEPEADDARSGVVVPLGRTPLKAEPIATPFTPSEDAALTRTLRLAAARGAATVYIVAQSKPMIRVDGEIMPLETEPMLSAADVDRLVIELAPPRRRDALQNGPVEWLCDIPEVGRVRCLTFRDHRGPGVLFRMFPPRAISADQLGLTPEVQALCQQSDGLVLVTGARASGKSTLLNAFVDLINRTRSDHVITIESQIGFVHESRKSFISQRETRGDSELAASVARAALREDPDVMMIEELKSGDLVSAALEAAESGRLVLASVPAASTIAALERVIELLPADRRARGRASLATSLRGVVAQVLLRRVTGGRVAAREILLNTPAVSTLVLEGKMFQLPVALDSGRRHGMVPLTDSLAAQVREGTVQPGEAYRKALDRAALVAALKRDGVDTSFAERLA